MGTVNVDVEKIKKLLLRNGLDKKIVLSLLRNFVSIFDFKIIKFD